MFLCDTSILRSVRIHFANFAFIIKSATSHVRKIFCKGPSLPNLTTSYLLRSFCRVILTSVTAGQRVHAIGVTWPIASPRDVISVRDCQGGESAGRVGQACVIRSSRTLSRKCRCNSRVRGQTRCRDRLPRVESCAGGSSWRQAPKWLRVLRLNGFYNSEISSFLPLIIPLVHSRYPLINDAH